MEDYNKYFEENTVSGNLIKSNLRERKSQYISESIHPKLEKEFLYEGWELYKRFKTSIRVKKKKTQDLLFEDRVWCTFASLGFTCMNKNRNFRIYDANSRIERKFDVFAADDETILIVECKSADGDPQKGDFEETIKEICENKEGIIKILRNTFKGHKQKIKFILATNNYYLSDYDIVRLDNYDIIHFDQETIAYYEEIGNHLGVAARFQLLGFLFDKQDIPELDNKVPALKGKMGSHHYFTFLIEPEKLLKIGYVLHRNKANKKLMPTYQRLIKKSRLKSVQSFVEEGGYFPNSLIISIDTKRPLRFDPGSNDDNCISRMGTLYLPKQYRSAFIIDGQHRLYGYANSEYKTTNSIPVVAFENLVRQEQVKLFMQINENQKSVNKNLRNTLNADLLWDSDNLIEQIKALKLQIAQDLGEDLDSPLYDKVIVGENSKTGTRCITIDTIRIGLDRSNFFGTFTKTGIKSDGTFYKRNNQETYDSLMPFLKYSLGYIKANNIEQWRKGDIGDGYLTTNAGIEAILRILSDIVDHLVSVGRIQPKSQNIELYISEIVHYIDPINVFFKNIDDDGKLELKKSYGVAGRTKYWRILQKSIHELLPDFMPKDLESYWKSKEKSTVEKAFSMLSEIESQLKTDVKAQLIEYYGGNWFKKGVHPKTQEESTLLALQKNREIDNPKEEREAWDCLMIIDYRTIAMYAKNWSEIFEKTLTKPGEEKISGGKEAKTKWMQKLETIRNEIAHSYRISVEDYDFLEEIKEWLVDKIVDNNL